MKISIWRQFSSNHSGHFDVLGVFTDRESAQKAVDEINAIIQQIRDWHKNNPDKSDALWEIWARGDFPKQTSEIEEQLAKKYHVRWFMGIEWFDDIKIEIIQNHIVHLTTQHQMDDGAQPFVQIMERLGGYGLITGSDVAGEPFGNIWVSLSCEAPDLDTAQEIEQKQKSAIFDDDEFPETVSLHGTHIRLGWEWHNSGWDLVKLIDEMREHGCNNITYQFFGRTYTDTLRYPVESGKR